MNVAAIRATVGQFVNQRRIGMKSKDDRLVLGEEFVEIDVAVAALLTPVKASLRERRC
jgi:hypothetical protein